MLTLEELKADVASGAVDTVIIAMCDMQGRLQGKRLTARHFLDSVVEHGAEACNYLLGVDVEMNTVAGYDLTSWEGGYGDFALRPDLETLRIVPWHDATALVLCDVLHQDGGPVAPSPRQVLRAQLEREYRQSLANPYVAAARGYVDDVIEPRETRPRLINALQMLQNKRDTNPPKKHGNIPL